jgi:hypothetical protein
MLGHVVWLVLADVSEHLTAFIIRAFTHCLVDGSSKFLRNIGQYLLYCMEQDPGRQPFLFHFNVEKTKIIKLRFVM